MSSFFCLCPHGFMLGDDYKTCQGNITPAAKSRLNSGNIGPVLFRNFNIPIFYFKV
jgi:hypothetical protein